MNDILRTQQTVCTAVRVTGFGYWSGRDVRIEFRPAPANTGVVFLRDDLRPAVPIPAAVHLRVETPRRTTLVREGARVEMVEHILAALSGMWIDNCVVAVSGAEMPGVDGSSMPFVDALRTAGVRRQRAW